MKTFLSGKGMGFGWEFRRWVLVGVIGLWAAAQVGYAAEVDNEMRRLRFYGAELDKNFRNGAYETAEGYIDKIVQQCAVLIERYPQQAWPMREVKLAALLTRAKIRSIKEQHGPAVDGLDRAIKEADEYKLNEELRAEMYTVRGMAKFKLRRYREAETDLSTSLRLSYNADVDKILTDLRAALAASQKASAQKQAAAAAAKKDELPTLAELDAQIRTAPTWEAHANRAFRLFSLNRHSDALLDFDRAMKLAPAAITDPQFWFLRGDALRLTKQYDEALASLLRADEANRAVNKKPHARALEYRAALLMSAAKAGGAVPIVAELIPQAEPLAVTYFSLMGFVDASRAGDLARAQQFRESARQRGDAKQWPAPVWNLFDGVWTPAQVVEAAVDKDSKTTQNRKTEALAYIGCFHVIAKRYQDAALAFDWVLKNGNREFSEWDVCYRLNSTLSQTGEAAKKTGDPDAAIEAYFQAKRKALGELIALEKQIKQQPENWALREKYAEIAAGSEDYVSAREAYRYLLAHGPRASVPTYEAGLAQIDAREKAAAEAVAAKERRNDARAELRARQAELERQLAETLDAAENSISTASSQMQELQKEVKVKLIAEEVPAVLPYDESKPASFWETKAKDELGAARRRMTEGRWATVAKYLTNTREYFLYAEKKSGRAHPVLARIESDLAQAQEKAKKEAAGASTPVAK